MDYEKHVRGVVTRRNDLTASLRILNIRPDRQVPFVPGQYVTIGLKDGDRIVERPYSVTSRPKGPELEFLVEAVSGGQLSPCLCALPVGAGVFLRPAAKGLFTFDSESGHKHHFMIATGTGVAPYLSMVRDWIEDNRRAPCYEIAVLHSARVSAELAYREELFEYARLQWLHYIPAVSRIWQDPAWPGERGRAEDVARKHLDGLGFGTDTTTVYLCGNPDMIQIMDGIVRRSGFPSTSIRKERYWPGKSVAASTR